MDYKEKYMNCLKHLNGLKIMLFFIRKRQKT